MQMGALENEKMFYFGYLMAKVLDQGIKVKDKENQQEQPSAPTIIIF